MDFSIISGAISALIGALIYHWVDKVKIRRKAIEMIRYELDTNKRILEIMLRGITKGEKQLYASPFLFDAYNFIKVNDPQLIMYIDSSTHGTLTEIYLSLQLLNEVRRSTILGLRTISRPEAVTKPLKELLNGIDKLNRFILSVKIGLFGKLKVQKKLNL